LSAASLQSPDDWEAAYRCKHGQGQRGYVANVSETCHPENPFQLIVNVQSEPDTTDDAALLAAALPELAERSDVDELHTDGGYNSPQVDDLMQTHHVRQVQTAIRGLQPTEGKVGLEDMTWQTNADNGQPEFVTCPGGQRAEVVGGRKEGRYVATFDASVCADCPLREQCPAQPLVRRAGNVLRFSQREVNVALRRQRCAEERAAERHLRPAVEATIRAITHPFRNGKAPVRGRPRVSMLLIGSAAMNNVRQIYRCQRSPRGGRSGRRRKPESKRERLEAARAFFLCFSLDSVARTSMSDAPRAARLGLLALTFFRESQTMQSSFPGRAAILVIALILLIAPVAAAPSHAPAAFERGTITQRPYVVMIDNHPNAYPQTGLDKRQCVRGARRDGDHPLYGSVHPRRFARCSVDRSGTQCTALFRALGDGDEWYVHSCWRCAGCAQTGA
jgi:hypothetical protein